MSQRSRRIYGAIIGAEVVLMFYVALLILRS
jgi:hypothetical protein